MEGPSLKIAREEMRRFIGRRILGVAGAPKIVALGFRGRTLRGTRSWGKYLILGFGPLTVKIHFLMFGSYRIDDPRANRTPKLELRFANGTLYFYSCSIRKMEAIDKKAFEPAIDLMSERWDPGRVGKLLDAHPAAEVADALMDQRVFAGLGNIIKNEVLFRKRLHPETRIGDLPARARRALVRDAHDYSWLFYEWKKKNVLKRNWKIFRKRVCPVCGGKVTKRPTGRLQRVSHFCVRCQPKPSRRPGSGAVKG